MRSLGRLLSLLVVLLAALTGSIARAQSTSVVVLGLTSIDGDDTFATNLSGALRQAASQVRGWAVAERDVPLSQLELSLSCEATELSCVQQIATAVGAQRLVYGTIQRVDGSGGRYEFRIQIDLYDTASGTVLRSLDERLPSSRTDIDDLREPARRFATALATGAATSTTTSAPGPTPEGDRSAAGEDDGAGAATATAGGSDASSPEPSSSGGGPDLSRLNWPAFALLAAGVLSAVGWIVAGLDAQTNMQTVDRFRHERSPTAASAADLSICSPSNNEGYPETAAVRGACDSPAEILQFVFMGATIIAGATGAALLGINGVVLSDESGAERARLSLEPSVGRGGGGLRLQLTF